MTPADRMTRIAIALAVVSALASGCASVADPPMPQGRVDRKIIMDYQSALIRAQEAREARRMRVTRSLNIACQAADVITTLVAVERHGATEMNPLLPDPKKNTEAFIAVKFSWAWFADKTARDGYHNEVRMASAITCGAALWNIGQMLK